MIRHFLKSRDGAAVVEYAVIIAVLSLVVVGGISQATNAIEFLFSSSDSKLVNALATNP